MVGHEAAFRVASTLFFGKYTCGKIRHARSQPVNGRRHPFWGRHQWNPGTWIWIGVGDVDVLFQELSTTGASIRLEPTNYQWAYEMQVEDPDGHGLRFGSDPKTDRVFSAWVVVTRDR